MAHTPETTGPRSYYVPAPDGRTLQLVCTWTDQQAAEIIGRAISIVEQLDPPDDLRDRTFATALNLCGQMAPKQSGITLAPPMTAIENGKGL